jgi:dTDP-4-dehydrorhamnose reductase
MIIVTGANGQLGQSLKQFFSEALYFTSSEFDITDLKQGRMIFDKYQPTLLINAAAFTKVDLAETEKEKCFQVNFQGVHNLASLCKEYDCALIHYSTDYVFDGSKNTPYLETDLANPLSTYGKSKLAGEQALREICPNFLILRVSWLYSEYGHNFVKTMNRLLKEKESLNVVFDQIGSPTYAEDLAELTFKIYEKYNTNFTNEIYHFANSGVCSWFDLTYEIKNYLKSDCKINPIESFEYPTPVKRPSFSVLNTKKIIEFSDFKPPYWKESLFKCLQKISS